MGKLIAPVVEQGSLSTTTQPTIIIDDDLLLRPFDPSDTKSVLAAFSTPDIQHFHFRRYDTEREARQWIEECGTGWRAEKSATWAIVDRATGRVGGRVTIYLSLEDGHGEVSYWVLPSSRGRGVATRACVAATRWAHQLGLHRIQLEHSTRNDPSRRVALRAGFTAEGVRRGANLHTDGWHDMTLYSHLATDPLSTGAGTLGSTPTTQERRILTPSGPAKEAVMGETLSFHDFSFDKKEHQLEPDDRVVATYLVTNRCDCVELTDVELTHPDRVANDGTVVLRCEPATVRLAGSMAPNEERQVTVELITTGHVPGRHPLRVQARFGCRPVIPTATGLFEFTVAAD